MARRKKDAEIQLAERHGLTAGLIAALACPAGKAQAFLRDTESPGLRVRVTAAGAKSFVFEGKLNRQTIRQTIGDVRTWTIPAARVEANRLRSLLDRGADPRELERDRLAAAEAKREAALRHTTTVSDAWDAYLTERRPKWGERHYRDHIEKAAPGGVPSKRGGEATLPGPLAALMPLALHELDAATVEAWAEHEAATRPTSARLAWRLLKAFLGWCAEQQAYAGVVPAVNPAKTKKARESLGKPGTKSDALQREQLPAWFGAVRGMTNPVVAAYLQTMLLTGARPGEILTMRWDGVNTQWKGLTIRDKDDGERTIPLTPYVEHLLAALPRRNPWVFSGARAAILARPNELHARACAVAGLEGLTLHGLRRSFTSVTEWLEVPAGVVAQLMGHKPSATAERHYKVRPLDLLRVHHRKIEAWILEQAGVTFEATAAPNVLRVVTA